MSFLRHALREYAIYRLGGGRHRRYGYGRRSPRYRSQRPTYPFVLRSPRRRSRVHVTGCCLPIPLGVLVGSTVMGRALVRRRS